MISDVNKHGSRPALAAMADSSEDAIASIRDTGARPEFIRLPKSPGRCAWTGLSRASLNELVLGPGAKVESVVLRRKGASRGIRLIHLDSLLTFLHGAMAQQAGESEEGEARE
jgi:hypothetical protein